MRNHDGWGLIVDLQSFLSESSITLSRDRRGPTLRKRVRSYGVIAAQRRPEGQIWVVIAGLTGPGTYAAATCLNAVEAPLPNAEDPHRGQVLWAVVEATVFTEPMLAAV